MHVERVEFTREGGFTGIPVTITLDTDSLSPEEAATLERLIQSADFFKLPSVIASQKHGADRFQFNVTVEADGKRHTVRTREPAPPSLQPLLEFLQKLAKRKRAGA